MYITAGLFNILLKQFEDVQIDTSQLFLEFKTNPKVLESPLIKIDARILGRYLEQIVIQKNNNRIGLEIGFILPFVVTGGIFNICRNSTTVRELFANPFDFIDPTANDIHEQTTKEEGDFFYFEIAVNQDFEKAYPIGARQWIEMQYGIALQYAYSFTGRYLSPVLAHSIYPKEGEYDELETYLGCPVKFGQNKLALMYNIAVLDLPIISTNRGLLPIFEDYMHEIRRSEEQQNANWSNSVRRFLTHSLSVSYLSLDLVAERFNMSKRNLHRKLKAEGTSYQEILNELRMELSRKYLNKKVNSLEKQLFIDKKRATLPIGNLRWTGPLIALTEFGYGFDASEYVNNGKADIKEIMTGLEILFNVDLGKYYRTYISMRDREEQTKYLKIMIERLKKRMDEDDS